ncbi:MAG: hypothetical protein B7X11_06455 [Acidobacteria bacterium 37-65-4]|nr:MAG: hypothetical protein B7X11_06455 [Acidobacteria bacterium 37-65-4]
MSTLNSMLDRAAQEGGEKTFLVHDGRALSFSAVYAEVRSVAEGLRRFGVGKGDRVAIIHRNAPEFVIAYFAINRLGAIAGVAGQDHERQPPALEQMEARPGFQPTSSPTCSRTPAPPASSRRPSSCPVSPARPPSARR